MSEPGHYVGDDRDLDDALRALDGLARGGVVEEWSGDFQILLPSMADKFIERKPGGSLHIRTTIEVRGAGFPLSIMEGSKIHAGGGAIVFEVRNTSVNRPLSYALKIPRPSLAISRHWLFETQRNKAEYANHAPLSHPNVARVLTSWTIGLREAQGKGLIPVRVLLIEWVRGALPLAAFLTSRATDPVSFYATLIQCFSAIGHLHDQSLVHWDIKSDNLFVDEFDVVKLMDIGNARPIGGSPDTIALTTEGNYPPSLRRFVVSISDDDKLYSSNRVQLDLRVEKENVTSIWDTKWLDLWMMAREIALIIGLGHRSDRTRAPWSGFEDTLFRDDNSAETSVYSPATDDGEFIRQYVRLILRRLLRPTNPSDSLFYVDAHVVVHDLSKLSDEFGGAQGIPELHSIPQHVTRIPIAQNVPLPKRIKALIETAPFDRLRRHAQLGSIEQVYMGAAHSRLEHTTGVFFAACLYVKALFSDRSDVFWRIMIERVDIEALLLAALLHDLGHIAYGHFLEELTGLFSGVEHEAYAVAVLQGRVPQGGPLPFFDRALSDRRLLAAAMARTWGTVEEIDRALLRAAEILETPAVKERESRALSSRGSVPVLTEGAELDFGASKALTTEILHSIISGPIDADKLDYLKRDGHHAEVSYPKGIDEDRFFQSLTVMRRVPEAALRGLTEVDRRALSATVAVSEQGIGPLESILVARYQMFNAVYWHHMARAHTAMLHYGVLEYLHHSEDLEQAFWRLVNEFRGAVDDSALAWLEGQLHGQPKKAISGLRGARAENYKECFVLQYWGFGADRDPEAARVVYDAWLAQSAKLNEILDRREYVRRARNVRQNISSLLRDRLSDHLHLEDGEVLIDIPTPGRDSIGNVFVMTNDGPHQLTELTRIGDAVRRTFEFGTRKLRVFAAPALIARFSSNQEARAHLGKTCWEILREKDITQGILNFGENDARHGE